jgi:hypothetical protein
MNAATLVLIFLFIAAVFFGLLLMWQAVTAEKKHYEQEHECDAHAYGDLVEWRKK